MKMDCPIHCSLMVYKKGEYEVPMLIARRKKIITKQLQCSTQKVQYAKVAIEGRSRLEKEICRYHQYLHWKGFCKETQ